MAGTCSDLQHEGEKCIDDDILNLITLSDTVPMNPRPPLASITKLDFFQAGLSSLPSNLPKCLPNLSILFCMKNQFKTIPAIIGKCLNLQMVSFKSNQVTSIEPDALQEHMRWLILTDNKIIALPSTIGRCKNLQKLMLSGNQLRALPKEISNCHNLELVRLASNKFDEPPMELLNLPRLSWVAFSANPFLNNCIPLDEIKCKVFDQKFLDDPSKALAELGRGASGITRKYRIENTEVAVKEYYSNITSDGNPLEERKVSMACSSLGSNSLIKTLGKTMEGNLIMELLTDYKNLANPPSFQTCSRDIYDSNTKISDKQGLSMVEQLLFALMKLHQNGINHGDLYGHNILLSTKFDDQVWLTDFGAAFFYDTDSDYGKLIQAIERRAFKHLVKEIADVVQSQNLKNKLTDFSGMCEVHTFHDLNELWCGMCLDDKEI